MFPNGTITVCVIIYSPLVNTHKKDKKPDSPSSRHRTVRHGKVPYPVASLHPNKDHYLQVYDNI